MAFVERNLGMDLRNKIDILDCPVCQGPGLLEEENGWCFYVMCLDCGCQTAEVGYACDNEREEAAQRAARLWNMGKVISTSPGE